jgi:hypothetical protein
MKLVMNQSFIAWIRNPLKIIFESGVKITG